MPFPTGQKTHGTQGICPPGAWDPLLDLASSTQDHRMFCSNDQSLLPGPTRAPSLSHSSEGLLCFQVTLLWAPGAAETADGGGSDQSLDRPPEWSVCEQETLLRGTKLSGK